MGRINLNELAAVLAEKFGLERRTTQRFLNTVVSVVQAGIEKDRLVKIKGLGTFKVIDVEARESVNVNTGARLVIEGHSKLAFVPDAAMKELVNKPFSQFETVVLNDGVEFEDIQQEPATDEDSVAEEEAVVEEEMIEEEIIENEEPAVEEVVEPIAEKEAPIFEKEAPIVEKEAPIVEKEAPIVEKKEEKIAPLIGTVPEPADEKPQEEDETEEAPQKPQEEELVEDEVKEEYENAEGRNGSRWYRWLAASVLALAIGFAGGYYVGHYVVKPSATVQESKAESVSALETPKAEPMVASEDSVQAPVAAAATDSITQEAPKAEEPVAQGGVPEWERYNEMDPRTKNGYYYIMGLDRMEKVREGDNTKRIANRVFGAAEMACYIEVFNGISASTALEPGTEIKVPKVEPKKSVNKRLQQQQQQ